jgi:hypothetical protein
MALLRMFRPFLDRGADASGKDIGRDYAYEEKYRSR